MTTDQSAQSCPNPTCKRKDITDFSKCKHCGTRYDAQFPTASKGGLDHRVAAGLVFILMAMGGFIYIGSSRDAALSEAMAPLKEEIVAAKRPRVIEFYADWCGPCRAYGPAVDQCKKDFLWKIDVERLNVDDSKSKTLARALGVRSIPRTFLFNRDGELVKDFTGGTNAKELTRMMNELL